MLATTSATLTGTRDEHMSVSPTAPQHSSQLAAGGAQQGAEPPQQGPGDGLPRSIFVADDAPIHMVRMQGLHRYSQQGVAWTLSACHPVNGQRTTRYACMVHCAATCPIPSPLHAKQ